MRSFLTCAFLLISRQAAGQPFVDRFGIGTGPLIYTSGEHSGTSLELKLEKGLAHYLSIFIIGNYSHSNRTKDLDIAREQYRFRRTSFGEIGARAYLIVGRNIEMGVSAAAGIRVRNFQSVNDLFYPGYFQLTKDGERFADSLVAYCLTSLPGCEARRFVIDNGEPGLQQGTYVAWLRRREGVQFGGMTEVEYRHRIGRVWLGLAGAGRYYFTGEKDAGGRDVDALTWHGLVRLYVPLR